MTDAPLDTATQGIDRPELWFRLLMPRGALGPGKVALMRKIAETGSVSAAARALGMSHARSVKLVAEINALAMMPLVVTRAGGEAGGGAALTALGIEVLARYAAIEREVKHAVADPLAALAALLERGA